MCDVEMAKAVAMRKQVIIRLRTAYDPKWVCVI